MEANHQNAMPPPPPAFQLRVPPLRMMGVRRRAVVLTALGAVGVMAVAVWLGLGLDLRPQSGDAVEQPPPIVPPGDARPPELAALPLTYAEIPSSSPPPPPTVTPAIATPSPAATAADDQLKQALAAVAQVEAENRQLTADLNKYAAAAAQDRRKAWDSPLLFTGDAAHGAALSAELAGSAIGTAEPSADPRITNGRTSSTDGPDHQRSFVHDASAGGSPVAAASKGSSRYTLQAGAVIPAALLTGLNSDLPGDVIAALTQDVYDSITGAHRLIPHGSKLLGGYESHVNAGQDRVLLAWHRLLLPDGRSVDLDRMPGTDAAGYAGLSDRVDYHLGQLAAGTALSSAVAYAGSLARDPHATTNSGAGDVVGDTVAQEASRIGAKIVDRDLNVPPTITVRPGWPVRVLVDRDLIIRPLAQLAE